MSNMTEDQKRRIDEIKKKWAQEVEMIQDIEPRFNGFDGLVNRPYRELELKYMPMIQKILDESDENS